MKRASTLGLRREFASLLALSLGRSSMLTGPRGRMPFSHDAMRIANGSFRHAGQLFAMTILQGGSGPRVF